MADGLKRAFAATAKTRRQVWIGDVVGGRPTDCAAFLRDVVGWQVGCENAQRFSAALQEADEKGWLGRRLHHYPDGSPPTPAYCLTEAGFAKLRQLGGDESGARASHAFYEDWRSRARKRPFA